MSPSCDILTIGGADVARTLFSRSYCHYSYKTFTNTVYMVYNDNNYNNYKFIMDNPENMSNFTLTYSVYS